MGRSLAELADAGLMDAGWAEALAPVAPDIAALGDRLRAEVAADAGFASVLRHREVSANSASDGCAKVVVDGLKPSTIYYYRFVAPDGSKSPGGRTRTLPRGGVAQVRLAVFSCSNYPAGHFNAYGAAAQSLIVTDNTPAGTVVGFETSSVKASARTCIGRLASGAIA